MRKLSKNFYGQRQTVEAMSGMCANHTCVCYSFDCYCNSTDVGEQQSGQRTQNNQENYIYRTKVVA